METQGACDEVLALKQFLQGMLLTDLDEGNEPSLPASGKGVIRNDKLLELMGVAVSETSSCAGCSAYSLDDERPAAVAPLRILLSPQLREQQNTCQPDHDIELELEVSDRFDADEDESVVLADEDLQQESYLPRGYMNKTSAALLRRSGTFEPDFQARMKQFLLKNQQKKEKIRQSLRVEEEPDVDPTPRINQRSKSIPRNVSHLMAWNNEKENKLARMRDAEMARQEAICVGKPSISKRSLSIFSKRQDDVAQCKVEDRLHLLGLIYQYQQEERKQAEERRESSGLQPRLAPHSANAQRWRRFSVHERLYQLSKRSSAAMEENDRELCQRKYAARRRQGRSSNNRDLVDTAQRLHALDKKYKQKQQLLGEERKQHFDSLRTAPKMSARSRKLAARRKKNPAPKSPVRCGCCGGKEDNEGKCGCTIELRVNQKHAADIYKRQLKWKNANEARHTQQKQLQDTLAMTECTFRNPFYQKAWNTLDNKPTDKESKETSAAFFKRCMLWAEKRDQQVALEKKAFQERQLEECTFKPRVIARTPKYLASKSNQQDDSACPQSQPPSPAIFLDCSMATSPEHQDLTTEELATQLYSVLDLQALAGELSPDYNSIGSDDEGAHGFPKYSFTDLGEFAGR